MCAKSPLSSTMAAIVWTTSHARPEPAIPIQWVNRGINTSTGSVLNTLTSTSVFRRRCTRATLATVVGTIAGIAESDSITRRPTECEAYCRPNTRRNHGDTTASASDSGTTTRALVVSAARV